MRRICAWCRKELQGVDSQAGTENVITHGICKNCRDNILFQLGIELESFLNSLEVPIVLVNREGTVVTVNNRAKTMLCKDLPEIEGYKGGEVFECAYARLPEGCGNTTHCSGCTIRRTVMQTYATGRSFLRVPATLNQNTPEDPQKMNLLISTERIAELVLLRIDKLETNDAARQTPEGDR
jgi:PAS domain-containing protein